MDIVSEKFSEQETASTSGEPNESFLGTSMLSRADSGEEASHTSCVVPSTSHSLPTSKHNQAKKKIRWKECKGSILSKRKPISYLHGDRLHQQHMKTMKENDETRPTMDGDDCILCDLLCPCGRDFETHVYLDDRVRCTGCNMCLLHCITKKEDEEDSFNGNGPRHFEGITICGHCYKRI